MPKTKVVGEAAALEGVCAGMTIAVGGFADFGAPMRLLELLWRKNIGKLNLIGQDAGVKNDRGVARLIHEGRVAKLTAAHIGLNPEAGELMHRGSLQVELLPLGNLMEGLRCAGDGLGGVLTPTGIGTVVAEGHQIITVGGRPFILQEPIRADIALVKAWKADIYGNLLYRRSTRNCNPVIAAAAELVVVEADEIVPLGSFDPDEVVTPFILTDRIICNSEDIHYE